MGDRRIDAAQTGMGRPRTDLREVFNAIQYVLATGCQWRALPGDFPPYSTVINYFYRWQGGGVFDRMMDAFRDLARGEANRADSGDYRQPECEDDRERGPAR